jgi:hypothetical protein
MAFGPCIRTHYEAVASRLEGVTGVITRGRLHTQTPLGGPHVLASSNLGAGVLVPGAPGAAEPGGWWIIDKPESHFARDMGTRVPDWAGWRRERMADRPGAQPLDVVPHWIGEIVPRAKTNRDRAIKRPMYAESGVGLPG